MSEPVGSPVGSGSPYPGPPTRPLEAQSSPTPSGPLHSPPQGQAFAPQGPGYPPPQGPPHGPAYPAGLPAAPRERRRGTGLLVLVAIVALIAGIVGGTGAYLVGRRTSAPQAASPIAAPVPGVTTRAEGSIARIAAQTLPSVVTVRVRGGGASGLGSGFVIDGNGHILTNNHVIASAANTGVIGLDLSDGTTLSARIVGRDVAYDLAVLKIDRTDLAPLQFGRSADVVVGDGVIAVGAPLGLEATVTSGIVSALNRPVAAGPDEQPTSFINAIQTDAAINPGNSGGPLLDLTGKVIGVNTAIARVPGSSASTGGNIGVGFAIPSDQAFKTAEQLIATGRAVHPIIGVQLDSQFDGSGARIRDNGGVTPGSPAAAAGLQDGDVVVAFEGRRITDSNQLIVAIRARSVGDTVRLTVQRGGRPLEVTLTLQAAPAS